MAPLPYRDPSQPVESRVTDLLSRMTLAEKCAQLIGHSGLEEPDGSFSLSSARQHCMDGISYVGSHHRKRDMSQTVAYLNSVQKFLR